MARFSIEIEVGAEWDRVIKALRDTEHSVQKDLDQAMHDTAQGSVAKVKEQAMEIPALTGQHTGVRKRLARGVGVRRRGSGRGVRITTSMPEGEGALARGFDSPTTGWTHPVYGREPRVRQFPGTTDGWFREPIVDDAPRYEAASERVLEEAVLLIAAMGI